MKNLKGKFLFLSFLFILVFLIFLTGCGGILDYTATITITGVEKKEHAEAFKVTTQDFGTLEFTPEGFDNNTLTGTLTLSGTPSATLVINNDLFVGEYLTENEAINLSRKNKNGTFEVILSKTVADWDQLLDALDEPQFRLIILANDITLEDALLVERPVNFDLGGYSLINDNSNNGFNFTENFHGNLKNGYLAKTDGYVTSEFNGQVILVNVEFAGTTSTNGIWEFNSDAIFNDVRFNPGAAIVKGKLTLLDSMFISSGSFVYFTGDNAELQGNGNEVGCGVGGINFDSNNMLIKDVVFAKTLEDIGISDDAIFDGVTVGAVEYSLGIYDGNTLTFSGKPSTIKDNLEIYFGDNQSRIVAAPEITNRILATELDSNPDTKVVSFKLNQDIAGGTEITIDDVLDAEPVSLSPDKFDYNNTVETLYLTVKEGETIEAGTKISIEVTTIREWTYFKTTKVIIDSIIFSTWPQT